MNDNIGKEDGEGKTKRKGKWKGRKKREKRLNILVPSTFFFMKNLRSGE